MDDLARLIRILRVTADQLDGCSLDQEVWGKDFVWALSRPTFVGPDGTAPVPNVTSMRDELEFLESWLDDGAYLDALPFMLDKIGDVLRGAGEAARPSLAPDPPDVWHEWDSDTGLVGATMFRKRPVLDSARAFLHEKGYREFVLDCTQIEDGGIHSALRSALELPDWFGANWDAYDEAFQGGFGFDQTDLISFVLLAANQLNREELAFIVDGALRQERGFLLSGGRLCLLIQSDDPYLDLGTRGGLDVGWNQREWMNKDRFGDDE